VIVTAKIENVQDLFEAERGLRTAADVRMVEVADALVDTDATLLSLPRRIVAQLGLATTRTRRARTAAGVADFPICSPVRLIVGGRDCIVEVAEVPNACPPIIGPVRWRCSTS
jgi:predicted aspartyl protease